MNPRPVLRQHGGAGLRKRRDCRARRVVLDDHALDRFDSRNAVRRVRVEFVSHTEDERAAAAGEHGALERRVREFERAHAFARRNRARAQKAAIDVHVQDARHGGRVDAASHHRVHGAAHHDEPDVGAPEQRGGDIDRVGGHG